MLIPFHSFDIRVTCGSRNVDSVLTSYVWQAEAFAVKAAGGESIATGEPNFGRYFICRKCLRISSIKFYNIESHNLLSESVGSKYSHLESIYCHIANIFLSSIAYFGEFCLPADYDSILVILLTSYPSDPIAL